MMIAGIRVVVEPINWVVLASSGCRPRAAPARPRVVRASRQSESGAPHLQL